MDSIPRVPDHVASAALIAGDASGSAAAQRAHWHAPWLPLLLSGIRGTGVWRDANSSARGESLQLKNGSYLSSSSALKASGFTIFGVLGPLEAVSECCQETFP